MTSVFAGVYEKNLVWQDRKILHYCVEGESVALQRRKSFFWSRTDVIYKPVRRLTNSELLLLRSWIVETFNKRDLGIKLHMLGRCKPKANQVDFRISVKFRYFERVFSSGVVHMDKIAERKNNEIVLLESLDRKEYRELPVEIFVNSPGGLIASYENWPLLQFSTKLSVIHEIGHVLGLKHEQVQFDPNLEKNYKELLGPVKKIAKATTSNFMDQVYSTTWAKTPYDSDSVMNTLFQYYSMNQARRAAESYFGESSTGVVKPQSADLSPGDVYTLKCLYNSEFRRTRDCLDRKVINVNK